MSTSHQPTGHSFGGHFRIRRKSAPEERRWSTLSIALFIRVCAPPRRGVSCAIRSSIDLASLQRSAAFANRPRPWKERRPAGPAGHRRPSVVPRSACALGFLWGLRVSPSQLLRSSSDSLRFTWGIPCPPTRSARSPTDRLTDRPTARRATPRAESGPGLPQPGGRRGAQPVRWSVLGRAEGRPRGRGRAEPSWDWAAGLHRAAPRPGFRPGSHEAATQAVRGRRAAPGREERTGVPSPARAGLTRGGGGRKEEGRRGRGRAWRGKRVCATRCASGAHAYARGQSAVPAPRAGGRCSLGAREGGRWQARGSVTRKGPGWETEAHAGTGRVEVGLARLVTRFARECRCVPTLVRPCRFGQRRGRQAGYAPPSSGASPERSGIGRSSARGIAASRVHERREPVRAVADACGGLAVVHVAAHAAPSGHGDR